MHYCQGTSEPLGLGPLSARRRLPSCRPRTTGLVGRWLLAVLVGLATGASVTLTGQTPGPAVEGAPDGPEASYLRREVTVPMER